jgi:hypothetical protein
VNALSGEKQVLTENKFEQSLLKLHKLQSVSLTHAISHRHAEICYPLPAKLFGLLLLKISAKCMFDLNFCHNTFVKVVKVGHCCAPFS